MMQSPKIDIEQFWQALRASHLVPEAEVEELVRASASISHNDTETLAAWLVGQKAITPLHGEVLKSGQGGPFDFGRYRILSQCPGEQVWEARDRKTLYPVFLHFFLGESSEDLARWDRLEQRVEPFEAIDHPNLVRVYECVTTPKYRFVASERFDGKSLSKRMPPKRRLEEDQAMALLLPVAAAVAEIEDSGISHGSLSLEHVLPKSKVGSTKVLPPMMPADFRSKTETRDAASLGRLLFRLLSGRDAVEQASAEKMDLRSFTEALSLRKVRDPICELVYESVCQQDLSASDFFERLTLIAGRSYKAQQTPPSTAEDEFVAGLLPWKGDADSRIDNESIPDVDEEVSDSLDEELIQYRKKKLPVAMSLGLSLLGFAILLLAAGYFASSKKLDPPAVAIADESAETEAAGELSNDTGDGSEATGSNVSDEVAPPKVPQPVSYVQTFIEDDQQTLWESPTTGAPIDISFVPVAPRIIVAVNWSSIYASQDGQRTIRALGPAMDAKLRALESRAGFSLAKIKSMVVSLHSSASLEYETCAVVTLLNPSPTSDCLDNWKQPSPIAGAEDVFEGSGTAWWIADKSDAGEVRSFVVGPAELVRRAAGGEVAYATGTLRKLVASSDADRDINLIFPMISLFNTEGQKLLADQQSWANELRFALPEPVRGLLLSLHFDKGDYLEIRVDHSSELNASETVMEMRSRSQNKLAEISTELDQRQAIAFWEPLRTRFSGMLRELKGQLRWGSEFDRVTGNAWLPPGALHNLIAATELAMTFEPRAQAVAAAKPKIPQTLEELLAARRDLSIANPPDLNVLLKNIQEEVSDQYLEMPFEFNIRIAGADLQKEGITQNQRPGPLKIKDKSLSDILTQVMVSANPSRDITGPSDPNCKLVWVLDKDPASGKNYVLVTTRAAASEKGFTLPTAFVAQP